MNLSDHVSVSLRERICKAFLGYEYPALVAILTLVGYMTGLELYLSVFNMLLLSVGIIACGSLLPIIPTVSMFLFGISMQNSPESHVGSDYYLRIETLLAYAIAFLIVIVAAVYVLRKNGTISRETLRGIPFPAAAIILSAAFLLNGALTEEWGIENTVYGVILIGLYFLYFYFMYLAVKREHGEHVVSYLIFTTAMTALVLVVETFHLYLTREGLFVDGSIVKEEILYGWGMWTMAGQFIAMTIPLCFLGVMRGKFVPFYFTVATLALAAAIMTLSRNSLLIATLAYALSAIGCCFFGKSKRLFRILVPTGAVLIVILAIIFRERIFTVLSDYFNRGFSDNGRFELWEHGINSFISSPIFGKGFFGIQRELPQGCTEGFSFYPRMMHNTPIQLLGSMGIVGFIAYGYYRVMTALPFLRRPSLEKTMLGATLLVIIVGSLIDNFLFLYKHMLFYPIVLAATFKLWDEEKDTLK